MRVVDYKTGRSPSELFEGKALFQMKFYALVLWRLRGEIPRLLQLVYLGNGEVVRYAPDEHDLLGLERNLKAVWAAIERAAATGDWRPQDLAAVRLVRLPATSARRGAARPRRCPRTPPLHRARPGRLGPGRPGRRLRHRLAGAVERPCAGRRGVSPRRLGTWTAPTSHRDRHDVRHGEGGHPRRDGRAHPRR